MRLKSHKALHTMNPEDPVFLKHVNSYHFYVCRMRPSEKLMVYNGNYISQKVSIVIWKKGFHAYIT